ncbi:hypothetical protein GGTG_13895 [Gaeumannomyces tritici R3-111a-1]|uniref:Uncharacterized protein n=1 Tax=Gaeumannomyces tritici (strain R3-111a-1) TaxID=644352 RepID=J3PK49_GAET3|nr:hypothetical protein GGTG_13895 [Gaeumannomyces tritici R3-111a-1]EJT68526.1 hypothetical protein GGTG_13895 [Gaeumannomyces tritici R3-111a-1]
MEGSSKCEPAAKHLEGAHPKTSGSSLRERRAALPDTSTSSRDVGKWRSPRGGDGSSFDEEVPLD